MVLKQWVKIVSGWFKPFTDRKEVVEGKPHSNQPSTSTTPEYIQWMWQMLVGGWQLFFENEIRRIEDKPRQCKNYRSQTFEEA